MKDIKIKYHFINSFFKECSIIKNSNFAILSSINSLKETVVLFPEVNTIYSKETTRDINCIAFL